MEAEVRQEGGHDRGGGGEAEHLGLVEDAMTRDVITISESSSLSSAARELERAGVSGAPVVRDGRVVGVVTLADLLAHTPGHRGPVSLTGPFNRVEHLLAEVPPGTTVRHAMTAGATTVDVEDSIVHAASIMVDAGVNRLPVVDLLGSPCGILTRDDVIAAVARLGRPHGGIARRPQMSPD
jgi:CBS domain-containing protein